MSEQTHDITRRTFLAGASLLGPTGFLVNRGHAAQQSQIFEIVSTEEAELYYEFAVRGSVEGAATSDKIEGHDPNDAIIIGTDPGYQVVRGYTGNPGYGDAYAVDGELVFFAQTGGTSEYHLRLDGRRVSLSEITRRSDPTIPEPTTYIERPMDGTFAIVTPTGGELYYEFVVDGRIEPTATSEKVGADVDGNDAVSSSLGSNEKVVRGFTGNPGYGDAYTVDGELVAFRKSGGTADYVFQVDEQEQTLEELADSGIGLPIGSPNQDLVSELRAAMQELDLLGRSPGAPDDRTWYNRVHGQMRRTRSAIDELVERGYRFGTDVGDDLVIEILTLEQAQAGGSDDAPTVTVSSPVLVEYAVLQSLTALGIVTASEAVDAVSYLTERMPLATDAVSSLYSSFDGLFLFATSTIQDASWHRQLRCRVTGNVASQLSGPSGMPLVAQRLTDRFGECQAGDDSEEFLIEYVHYKFFRPLPWPHRKSNDDSQ